MSQRKTSKMPLSNGNISSDDEPLIKGEDDVRSESFASSSTSSAPRKGRRLVLEPFLLFYILAGVPMMNIRSQFFYKRVQAYMGIELTNVTGDACAANMTEYDQYQQQLVQSESATWQMYIGFATFFPSFFMTIFFGIYSDRFGRRIMFILPCFGSVCSVILYMAINNFDLPLPFFFLEVLEYSFGGMGVLFTGAFAYISDTVDKEQRALRMTIVDCIFLVGAAIGDIGAGYLIKSMSFLGPLYLVLIGKLIALFYAIFFIPETVKSSKYKPDAKSNTGENTKSSDPSKKSLSLADFKHGFNLYLKDNGTGRRCKLNLILLSYLFAEIFSVFMIMSLYEMNSPLCWTSVMMGIYGAVSWSIRCVMSLLAAFVLRRFKISEAWIAVIAKIQGVAETLYLAFVTTTAMMFLTPVIGCISFLATPMMRALVSKQVEQNEQGAAFAILTAVFSLSGLFRNLAVNKVYASTLLIFRGFIFLISGGFYAISLLFMLIYVYKAHGFRGGCFKSKPKLSIQA